MSSSPRRLRWTTAVALLFCGSAAIAQVYPTKPLRLVLPFPAGGSADVTARVVGVRMGESLGQPIIVDNRVGGAGVIGSEAVARSAPDGYTIMFTPSITHIGPLFLAKSLPYDPIKDFTPISAAAEAVSALVVNNELPVSSVKELVELARRSPGKLTYSSAGVGSAFHLAGELFRQAAGIDIVHVPYKGANQALTDLMNGNISMTFSAIASQLPLVRAGKVKLLAVLQNTRYVSMPNIPTVKETLPAFNRPESWLGFFGPAGLPGPVLARLSGEVAKAVNLPDVRDKFEQDGLTPIGNTPEQFAAQVRVSVESYGAAIKAAGLKPE